MSDVVDIDSPRAATGGRPTSVDPKLFGKPSEFSADRRVWRHFERVFRNWFGFLYDAAASAVVELGEAVPERRETDKALHMSLAMVCKNDALDVGQLHEQESPRESHGKTTPQKVHLRVIVQQDSIQTGTRKRELTCEHSVHPKIGGELSV